MLNIGGILARSFLQENWDITLWEFRAISIFKEVVNLIF